MRVVLDTNVLVSALLTRDGPPAWVLQAVHDGHLVLVLSEPLLEDLREVLRYPKIRKRLDAHSIDVTRFIELLRFFATLVATNASTVRDPDDRELLAVLWSMARPTGSSPEIRTFWNCRSTTPF